MFLFRLCILSILLFLSAASLTEAKEKEKKKISTQQPGHKNEYALVEAMLQCFRTENAECYEQLFPKMSLLSRMLLSNAPRQSRAYQVVLKEQTQLADDNVYDSVVRAALRDDFDTIINMGRLHNVHWNSIILQRYELKKMSRTRDTILEKIIPERFYGDVFFADALTGLSYALRVNDLNQIDGRWYGGQIVLLAATDNADDLQDAVQYEELKRRKLAEGDSTFYFQEMEWRRQQIKTLELDESSLEMDARQIAERELYKGTFDKEIGVTLYLRKLKGDCGEAVCGYDGLLKFHDQDDYILLHVAVDEEGNFEMSEDDSEGILFLEREEGKLKGNWTSAADKTVYELELEKETGTIRRFAFLDRMMLRLSE